MKASNPGIAAVCGTLLLAAVSSSATAQGAPNGATVFQQRCSSCHTVTAGKPATLGPNLSEVVGRKSGSSSGFNYSPALKKSGITWTKAALDKYLSAPAKLVPGTKMSISLSDPKQRAAVIEFLAKSS